MSGKLKIKIDGTVSANDIPGDAEELELECTEVADYAFMKNTSIRKLTLINVERIGVRAFNCKELVSVELINCKEISDYAFANNKKLQELTVKGAEIIGENAFSTCSNLLSAEFVNCEMTGTNAFKRCVNLVSAKLDCKEINERAFYECRSLKELTLLNTEVIDKYAFFRCYIDVIKLPDTFREFRRNSLNNTYIHHWELPPSFKNTKKLKLKTNGIVSQGDIPDDTEELELECKEIADSAFFRNNSLRRLKLINVERIGGSAFSHCKKLLSLEIINCKEIAELAFAANGLLLELTLINVEKISSKAFNCCKKLASLELTGCKETGTSAFEDCKQLARAQLDCKEIGDRSFSGCAFLNDLTFLNTEMIGENAFLKCISLKEIKLPDTLREIKSRAFYETSIYHSVMPPAVTKLGKFIFSSVGILEIYQNKDGTFPITPGCSPFKWTATIIARSAETDEILFQFMVPDTDFTVFTEHGVDFTEYDKALPTFWKSYLGITDLHIKAAQMRIRYPVGMSEETFKYFYDFISEEAANKLEKMMRHGYHISEFAQYQYYDFIKINVLMDIILLTISVIRIRKANQDPEILELLLKALCNKFGDNDGINDINDDKLIEIINYSAQYGLTEITAALMQKLNEIRSISGYNNPNLEL